MQQLSIDLHPMPKGMTMKRCNDILSEMSFRHRTEINNLVRDGLKSSYVPRPGGAHDIIMSLRAKSRLGSSRLKMICDDLNPLDIRDWVMDWCRRQSKSIVTYSDTLESYSNVELVGLMSCDQGYVIIQRILDIKLLATADYGLSSAEGSCWFAEPAYPEDDEDDSRTMLELYAYGYVDYDLRNWRPVERVTNDMRQATFLLEDLEKHGRIELAHAMPYPGFQSKAAEQIFIARQWWSILWDEGQPTDAQRLELKDAGPEHHIRMQEISRQLAVLEQEKRDVQMLLNKEKYRVLERQLGLKLGDRVRCIETGVTGVLVSSSSTFDIDMCFKPDSEKVESGSYKAITDMLRRREYVLVDESTEVSHE
ncbi:hypothetical protein ACYPKM_03940 [Pseudomonas aeruginosa]